MKQPRTSAATKSARPEATRPARVPAASGSPAAARAPLSVERIQAAALALVDAAGIEALSMRKLAAMLGVDPMSIYHHVPSKEALVHGVFQRTLEELRVPRMRGDAWQDGLRELARRFFALARRHPRVVPALIASRHATPREREIQAAIDRCLDEAGFEASERQRLGGAIFTYASGLASVAAHGAGDRPVLDPAAHRSDPRTRAPRPTTPRAQRAADAAALEYSIDLMIAGIEAVARRRAPPGGRRSG